MEYKSRLTKPEANNKNYIHYTKGGYNTCIIIDSKTGSVLPNCCGYAQGRFQEIVGATKENWKLPCCNAEDFFEKAKSNGLPCGSTAKLGAIICWKSGTTHNSKDGSGHVAVVEEIKANGDLVISESAYGKAVFSTRTVTKASNYFYDSNKQFQGFIYCGIEFTHPNVKTKYYRVQVGSYTVKENAEKLKKELEAKGYKPFITEVYL